MISTIRKALVCLALLLLGSAPSLAAVSASALTSGSSNAGGPYTTASVTLNSSNCYVLTVTAYAFSATVGVTAVTGGGWTEAGTADGVVFNSSLVRAQTFYRIGNGSSGTIELTNSSSGVGASWTITEFTGIDTGGTNCGNMVVQTVSGSTTGNDPNDYSLTLAALGSASNATFGFFANSGASSFTPGSGYTELTDLSAASSGQQTEWRATGSTTVNTTNSSGFLDLAGFAIEIKELAGGGGSGLLRRRRGN